LLYAAIVVLLLSLRSVRPAGGRDYLLLFTQAKLVSEAL
jgi:hypothetical protein